MPPKGDRNRPPRRDPKTPPAFVGKAPNRSDDTRTAPKLTRGGERHERKRDPDLIQLWGYHPVREALRSDKRKLLGLMATQEGAARVAAELAARTVPLTIVEGATIAERLPREAVHQGLLLETRPLPPLVIDDLPDVGIVLVLDQITDPHNVGAILRTAAAFGVAGLVVTERHAPHLTGTLAKAASGGLEHVPIIAVVNLARALEALGDRDYLRVGLDSDGDTTLASVAPSVATALVLGAEGKGLRRLTRENCDVIANLEFSGAIKSLNVSNACAVALTVLRQARSQTGSA